MNDCLFENILLWLNGFQNVHVSQQCDRIVRLDLIKEINGVLIRPIKYTKVLKYKIF